MHQDENEDNQISRQSRTYIAIFHSQQLWHEESVRDESDPGEGESREEERLQGVDGVTTKLRERRISKQESDEEGECSLPQSDQDLVVSGTQVNFDRRQIAQQTREEAEERFLLEVRAEFFVRVGEDENDDRENLRHVVYFRFIVVGSSRIGVVLDHEGDEFGESVDRLEDASGRGSSSSLVLDVTIDTDLGADSEEERRDLFSVENALLLKLNDEIDKRLFDVVRLLIEANPFGEAEGELLTNCWFVDGSLGDRNWSDFDSSRASFKLLKEFHRAVRDGADELSGMKEWKGASTHASVALFERVASLRASMTLANCSFVATGGISARQAATSFAAKSTTVERNSRRMNLAS